jgi:hypothetical protein
LPAPATSTAASTPGAAPTERRHSPNDLLTAFCISRPYQLL